MRQRICLAIAFACHPKLVIADEPTTALDVTIQKQIMGLLKERKEKQNTSILLITHDLALVREVADRVVVMYGGRIVEKGTIQEVIGSLNIHIRKAYCKLFRIWMMLKRYLEQLREQHHQLKH